MTHRIHPTIAAATLPATVQLRDGRTARLIRIEKETQDVYGLPLVGKIRLTEHSLPFDEIGAYHLWTASGHFATDNSAHPLDIVAIAHDDLSITPIVEEANR